MQETNASPTYARYAAIRDQAKLRDAAVSKLTGVSRATISEWKHGAYTPKIDKITRIAEALGVEPQAILEGGDR